MSDIDPTEGDVPTSPKRICSICGKKLSRHNNTGYCFHHPDPEKERRRLEREAYFEKTDKRTQRDEEEIRRRLDAEGEIEKEKTLQETIISLVCRAYGVDLEKLKQQGRQEATVRVRHVLMYLLYMDTSLSYPAIGEFLGGRDHSTVIHGVEKISNELEEDSSFRNTIHYLRLHYQTSTTT